jgi:integrase
MAVTPVETEALRRATRQAAVFLEAARKHARREHPLFLCALRTGMRLGELLGLQWGDVDFHGRFIEVRRNLVGGHVTTPESGKARKVDMSVQLTEALRALLTERKAETLRRGWGAVPDWVFCNENGGPLDGDNLRHRVFYPVLKGYVASASTTCATLSRACSSRTARALPMCGTSSDTPRSNSR